MRLPSVKTLSQVFGDRAKEARALLEGKKSTRDYESVRDWEKQCYHKPAFKERLLCALNEVAESHGVEALWMVDDRYWPTYEYLNMGDTYTPTLIHNHDAGTFRVCSVGDIVERNPNKFR